MSDNLTRYCAIQTALTSLRSTEATGNTARHLKTLGMLVSGIVGSQKCHLPCLSLARLFRTMGGADGASETDTSH